MATPVPVSKWAVLVVHGVGDTGPGVTVDNFLWSLVDSGAKLQPDGQQEVRWATEPLPGDASPGASGGSPGADRGGALPATFPIHVRRARVKAAPASPKVEVVFAEVYWADLSRIREGGLHLLYGVISSIFFLRFIPDWAAHMKRKGARWLRLLLHYVSW